MDIKTGKYIFLLILTAAAIVSGGCSTIVNSHLQKEDMMKEYIAGRSTKAMEHLDEKLKEPHWYNSSVIGSGDEIVWRLEAGTLNYILGDNDSSIAHFERVEALIEDFDSRAAVNMRKAGAEGAALVTNLNALPYRGLCRDRIMIPVFKALAYLGRKDEAGFRVELFSLREKQDKIIADYEKFFKAEEEALNKEKKKNKDAAQNTDTEKILSNPQNSSLSKAVTETKKTAHRGYGYFLNPFAIFMSAYGYARDDDYQNAFVDYERLYKAMPDNQMIKQYYVTAHKQTGRPIPDELKNVKPLDFTIGRNSVMVVFANGRSAAFRQADLYIPVVFPGYATVAATAWPVCEYYEPPCKTLKINAGGRTFTTTTIADMDGIIAQEYMERLPGTITRTALNTAIKEIGAYLATRAASEASDFAGIATALGTTIYKIATNTADTRSWEILPKEFQLVQFAMPSDRMIVLKPDGTRPITLKLPETAASAIIYVNAPSREKAAFSYKVLEFQSK